MGKEVLQSPGTRNTFIVDESSPLLEEQKGQEFHSRVSKLLSLTKWIRPGVLTVTSFLCSIVQAATQQDYVMLDCVPGYLHGHIIQTVICMYVHM